MSTTLKTCCLYIPQRWITVLIGFFGLFNAYSMRICLSIAITEMVVPINTTIEFRDDTCPDTNENNKTLYKSESSFGDKYEWSEYTQGVILSSFYWGYLLTNLPGGVVAEKFGGRHTLGLGVLVTAVLTILTPSCIAWGGSSALVALRVVMGFFEGAVYPSLSTLMAHWIPEDERSKAAAVTFSGAKLGTVFGMTGSGLILRYSAIGWPAVFYFYGGMGVLAFLLNSAFCYSKPSEHPFISESEANYLKEKLKNTHEDLPPTPWSHILTSGPVWALMAATIGNAWGFLTIISDMPKYLSSVLRFSIEDNGYLSSLPYLSMWAMSTVSCCLADHLIAKGTLSTNTVRKLAATIASLGPGIFIVAASYAGCDGFLAVAFLTTGMCLMGWATCSTLINSLDLGPNYAGTIMGLANGIGTLGGIVSPYVVGVITPNQTISEWRLVFWIVFGFFVVSNTIFLVFGSGNLQDWNNPHFLIKEKKFSKSDIKEAMELVPMK